ncbi:MAG: 2-hydroxychromene-2-carboxylate isomerase [Acetobacteraceae bacterium]|nr:2-hydroxychromene-2-carboxylate isomerase [Acetobacteraceae bacterium]MBV8525729.1 2-hydroxychromene-2-carboxylate isomerase [Acetobacteraceae bacterium]MBV8588955.1 2-hydroxychromene-2-carboxylate isomerase [Acetobacteraceae bacterium]
MMPKVEFLFDFGSPNAYLCYKLIPEIEERTARHFDYVPVLLGGIFKLTNNRPPMEAFADVRNKLEYERLDMRRFVRQHRLIEFEWNPFFPVNTLLLMRGAVATQLDGGFDRYVSVVFRNMWENATDMGNPEVAYAALEKAGLDPDAIFNRAQSPDVKHRLMENTRQAVERGTFGVPTIFVGDEIFFGKDRLREVEQEILTQSGHPKGP